MADELPSWLGTNQNEKKPKGAYCPKCQGTTIFYLEGGRGRCAACNHEYYYCPYCKSPDVRISNDYSGMCQSCNRGFSDVREKLSDLIKGKIEPSENVPVKTEIGTSTIIRIRAKEKPVWYFVFMVISAIIILLTLISAFSILSMDLGFYGMIVAASSLLTILFNLSLMLLISDLYGD